VMLRVLPVWYQKVVTVSMRLAARFAPKGKARTEGYEAK